jgi:hypothetical protein
LLCFDSYSWALKLKQIYSFSSKFSFVSSVSCWLVMLKSGLILPLHSCPWNSYNCMLQTKNRHKKCIIQVMCSTLYGNEFFCRLTRVWGSKAVRTHTPQCSAMMTSVLSRRLICIAHSASRPIPTPILSFWKHITESSMLTRELNLQVCLFRKNTILCVWAFLGLICALYKNSCLIFFSFLYVCYSVFRLFQY